MGEAGSPGPGGPRGDPGAPGLPGPPGRGKDGEPVSVGSRVSVPMTIRLELEEKKRKGSLVKLCRSGVIASESRWTGKGVLGGGSVLLPSTLGQCSRVPCGLLAACQAPGRTLGTQRWVSACAVEMLMRQPGKHNRSSGSPGVHILEKGFLVCVSLGKPCTGSGICAKCESWKKLLFRQNSTERVVQTGKPYVETHESVVCMGTYKRVRVSQTRSEMY